MKTILIPITRGLVARNVLRAGVLTELLKDESVQVVIAIPHLEKYFVDEFTSDRVRVVGLLDIKMTRLERLIQPIYRGLVFSSSDELCLLYGATLNEPQPYISAKIKIHFFRWFSQRVLLKRFLRMLVRLFPLSQIAVSFMDEISPSVLFATDIQATPISELHRVAARKNIPVVGMTKGTEKASRRFFWNTPEILLVQNGGVKSDAIRFQLMSEKNIHVVGFPQFDVYYKPNDFLMSRTSYLEKIGCDPLSKVIFFGSEGTWTANDDVIVEMLVTWNELGVFGEACRIVVRPHFFSDGQSKRYERFRGRKGVYIDTHFRKSTIFNDQWDPTVEDTGWLVNHLFHMDVMVTFASTLTLDAAMADKPIINVAFGAHYTKSGQDMTGILYTMQHYKKLIETGGIKMVYNTDDLRKEIQNALENPREQEKGRELLRSEYCCDSDGKSAKRIASYVLKNCNIDR